MSQKNNTYLETKDFSVSGESFLLQMVPEGDMLETIPKPAIEALPGYYKSENYISHTDRKANWFERVYHSVKKFTIAKKVQLINTLVTNRGSLLDIGAGTGDFLVAAKKSKWEVTGVEPNQEAVALALGKGIHTVPETSELEETFDIITMWHVLEHIPNLEAHIQTLSRLLKPNGKIIIAVPNYKSFDAGYYKTFWAAYDVPRHLWHFSRNAIGRLFKDENIHVVKILPMYFDAFYVSLLSEKYKTGSRNPFRAFCVGLWSNVRAMSSGEYSSLIYVLEKRK